MPAIFFGDESLACDALLAREVWGVERWSDLAETARANLERCGVRNAQVVVGDGTQGLREHAPFDAIVIAAALVSQVKPVYPQNARDAGIEGTVRLQAFIGADGSLIGLSALSSPDRDLTSAAIEAVRQWRYRPTMLNGEPVQVLTTIEVQFQIAQ